jgi:ADP-heptose:LPS heptosyltransferase
MRKLLLRNNLSLGDVVVCSAAIRDLHKAHPGKFITGYTGSCDQVFQHNPYIQNEPDAEEIKLEYPAIHKSNQRPRHFIEAYHEFLSSTLGVEIPVTEFKGDIHLTEDEKKWISQVHEILKFDAPFWIIVSGGKFDFTCKWWGHHNYQKVVDEMRDKVLFVHVGEKNHHHPPLNGVIDLRGKTNVRQLIRLVHHSQGIVCPVTSLMHLAAAVPAKKGNPTNRACIVVAGGREPVSWEQYPSHQFMHTIGMLPCCQTGGCWKSRTVALNDGDDKDNSLCAAPVTISVGSQIPKCMDMITPTSVVANIYKYLEGGSYETIPPDKWPIVKNHLTPDS